MEAKENPIKGQEPEMNIRNTEVDIIKGASDASNIEAMKHNAESSQSSSPANILEVNDGTKQGDDVAMEPINEFDQNEFYNHDHFEPAAFNEHNRSAENLASQEIDGTASMSERAEEEARDENKT